MANYVTTASDKSKNTTFLLCCLGFIGLGGIHDFYVGKIGSGLIKLITGNWFVFGTFIDLIKISSGSYTDSSGAPIRQKSKNRIVTQNTEIHSNTNDNIDKNVNLPILMKEVCFKVAGITFDNRQNIIKKND